MQVRQELIIIQAEEYQSIPTYANLRDQGERVIEVLHAQWAKERFLVQNKRVSRMSSLRQVSKCLTMLLAIYLAKEVAAILREILTHPTKRLYDDNTAHLLCSNYWVQPIYQELLHSSSRYNATRTGEKNRPSNGLARISAHPWPPKKLKPAASGTRFTDWIGGICYADSAGVVSRPLSPCGTAPAATQGGLQSCPPILDGPGGCSG